MSMRVMAAHLMMMTPARNRALMMSRTLMMSMSVLVLKEGESSNKRSHSLVPCVSRKRKPTRQRQAAK